MFNIHKKNAINIEPRNKSQLSRELNTDILEKCIKLIENIDDITLLNNVKLKQLKYIQCLYLFVDIANFLDEFFSSETIEIRKCLDISGFSAIFKYRTTEYTFSSIFGALNYFKNHMQYLIQEDRDIMSINNFALLNNDLMNMIERLENFEKKYNCLKTQTS